MNKTATVLKRRKIMETSKGIYEVMADCAVKENTSVWWNPSTWGDVKFYNEWLYLDLFGNPRWLYSQLWRKVEFTSVEEAKEWIADMKVQYPIEIEEIDKELYTPGKIIK